MGKRRDQRNRYGRCLRRSLKNKNKMRLKLFLGLFITVFSFVSVAFAFEFGFPLPRDAVKTSEKVLESGLTSYSARRYESSWGKNQISSFYRKELRRSGWSDLGNDVYEKNESIAVIQVRSKRDGKGKTRFFVIITKTIDKEKSFSRFMPRYPGSTLISFSKSSRGVIGKYGVTGSIRDVVFFYKTSMLRYGWNLQDEKFLNNKAILTFNKPAHGLNEGCIIRIAGSAHKIFFTVNYYDYKKIKFKR